MFKLWTILFVLQHLCRLDKHVIWTKVCWMEPHMICLHNKEECLTTYRWLFDFFKIYSNNFEKYLSCHFSRDPKFVLKTNKHNRKAIWVSFSVVCFESARGAGIRVRCAGREFMSSALEIKVCGKALRFQATRHTSKGDTNLLGALELKWALRCPTLGQGAQTIHSHINHIEGRLPFPFTSPILWSKLSMTLGKVAL